MRQHLWHKIDQDFNQVYLYDMPHPKYKTVEGESVGSKILYNRVKQLPELKYHCFGHIHEGYGVEKIDDVIFMNCSVVNRRYEVVNKPMVFDL